MELSLALRLRLVGSPRIAGLRALDCTEMACGTSLPVLRLHSGTGASWQLEVQVHTARPGYATGIKKRSA
jgi:hypothetical protein